MLKIRYILMLMLCVLMPVTVAFAETVTSTSGHHDQDIKDGKVVLKDAANRATFTLSGMDIKYQTRFGALNIDAYDLDVCIPISEEMERMEEFTVCNLILDCKSGLFYRCY